MRDTGVVVVIVGRSRCSVRTYWAFVAAHSRSLAIVNHDGNVFLAPRDEVVVRRREQQRQPQMCRGGGQAGVGYAKAQKYDCFGPPTKIFGD